MYPGYHFVDDLWDVWDKGRHYQHSVGRQYVAKSTWAADVKRSPRAQQAAKASRLSKFRRGASLASWLVPGLGTYKAAKAGHKLLFGMNLVGDVSLGVWLWEQINSPSDAITESTPKLPYDIEPWIESSEYQYQDLVGYEDNGPVHWSRTV